MNRDDLPEFILCAAVYVDDGKDHKPRSYAHPKTGIVFCGWRHGDCFVPLQAWADLLPPAEREAIGEEGLHKNQGFLTSRGRFVSREEAWTIARDAGQLTPECAARPEPWLMSEDVW